MGLRCDLLVRRTGCTHTHAYTLALRCAAQRGDDQDLPGLQRAGDGGGGRWSRRDAGSTSSRRHQRQPAKRPGPDHLPTKVCSLKEANAAFIEFYRIDLSFCRRARIYTMCCHVASMLLFSIATYIYKSYVLKLSVFKQELNEWIDKYILNPMLNCKMHLIR